MLFVYYVLKSVLAFSLPMKYSGIFLEEKLKISLEKKIDILLIFAQNIDCGYTLELPWRGGSNEYP